MGWAMRWSVGCTPLPRKALVVRRARKTTVRACSTATEKLEADLTLQAPSGWKVRVLGAQHNQRQSNIGTYILRKRPAAVLTETSLTPEQGSMAGGMVSCSSRVEGPAAFWVRMFCAVGAELEKQGEAAFAPGGVWHTMQDNYQGEQLAYVAAFALNKPVVFADRPKDITYKRLWSIPSLLELDDAFSRQALLNYNAILEECGAETVELPPNHPGESVVDRILMREREAVMCHVMDFCCERLAVLDKEAECKEIVAVLGSSHLKGVQELWESGQWRSIVGSEDLEKSPLMSAPEPPALSGHDMAVRRALLESMFRLSVPEQVIGTMANVLPSVPAEHEDVYDAVRQTYGTSRMLLSTLPPDMLPKICGGFETDMFSLLQRVRSVRPLHGGAGYDWGVLEELQMLYLMIEGEDEGEEGQESEQADEAQQQQLQQQPQQQQQQLQP